MKKPKRNLPVDLDAPVTLLARGRRKLKANDEIIVDRAKAERQAKKIKRLRAELFNAHLDAGNFREERDQALALYGAARLLIRKHQDADAEAQRRFEIEAMDRAEKRDEALRSALRDRMYSIIEHLGDPRAASFDISALLLYWPKGPTVTGLAAAARNRDGERPPTEPLVGWACDTCGAVSHPEFTHCSECGVARGEQE